MRRFSFAVDVGLLFIVFILMSVLSFQTFRETSIQSESPTPKPSIVPESAEVTAIRQPDGSTQYVVEPILAIHVDAQVSLEVEFFKPFAYAKIAELLVEIITETLGLSLSVVLISSWLIKRIPLIRPYLVTIECDLDRLTIYTVRVGN